MHITATATQRPFDADDDSLFLGYSLAATLFDIEVLDLDLEEINIDVPHRFTNA